MDQDWSDEQVREVCEADEEIDLIPMKNELLRVEEKCEHLYFSIRDYLYETSEIELLQYLNIDDCMLLLYNPIYIEYVKKQN